MSYGVSMKGGALARRCQLDTYIHIITACVLDAFLLLIFWGGV